MSYISQVAIAMSAETFYSAPKEVVEAIDTLFGSAKSEASTRVAFFAYVGWWGVSPESRIISSFLRNLDTEDFGFVRVGEDTSDVEELGTPYDWDLGTSISITY